MSPTIPANVRTSRNMLCVRNPQTLVNSGRLIPKSLLPLGISNADLYTANLPEPVFSESILIIFRNKKSFTDGIQIAKSVNSNKIIKTMMVNFRIVFQELDFEIYTRSRKTMLNAKKDNIDVLLAVAMKIVYIESRRLKAEKSFHLLLFEVVIKYVEKTDPIRQ